MHTYLYLYIYIYIYICMYNDWHITYVCTHIFFAVFGTECEMFLLNICVVYRFQITSALCLFVVKTPSYVVLSIF